MLHAQRHVRRLAATFAALSFQFAGNVLAFVPVYGGPEYNPSTKVGYQVASTSVPFQHNLVNNLGTAVGSFRKSTGHGSPELRLPLTWSPSAAPIELSLPSSYSNPSSFSWPYAINDSGTVVGAAYNDSLGERPIRWDASGAGSELDNLGTRLGSTFTWGQAYAINNSGTVVGYSDRWVGGAYYDRAARWDAGGTAITELGELPHEPGFPIYPQSRAQAVNESNSAVGYAQKLGPGGVNLGFRAVRWDGSGTAATELGHLGTTPAGVTDSQAYDINESGTVVGYALKNGSTGMKQAVRWTTGETAATELDDAGGPFSEALAINDLGTAVGYSGGGTQRRALSWDYDGTAATVLGHLADPAPSQAFDINNNGIAVGSASKVIGGVNTGSFAVAWREDGIAIDLNRFIDPVAGWVLDAAYSISDTNWITGRGQFDADGPGGLSAYLRNFTLQLPDSLPGDYNGDGNVDAADYVVWRTTDGTPSGHDIWRMNFDTSVGTGANARTNAALPEPTTVFIPLVATLAIFARRRESVLLTLNA
jgi:hypothetical protein